MSDRDVEGIQELAARFAAIINSSDDAIVSKTVQGITVTLPLSVARPELRPGESTSPDMAIDRREDMTLAELANRHWPREVRPLDASLIRGAH